MSDSGSEAPDTTKSEPFSFLHPIQAMIQAPVNQPNIQMRSKKTRPRGATTGGSEATHSTISHLQHEPFKRRSVERHSMAGFDLRRSSPRDPGGHWTDLFSSKKFRKRIKKHFEPAGDDESRYGTIGSTSTLASNSSGESALRPVTEEELGSLRDQFRKIMQEKNVKGQDLEEMMNRMTTDTMRQLIHNSNKTDSVANKKSPESLLASLKQILRSENILACKQEMVDVKVQLTCQNLSYTSKFTSGVRDEKGRSGFDLLCELYAYLIDMLKRTKCDTKEEIELVDFLQEVVKCIRSIMNLMSGMGLIMQASSPVVSLLIQTLSCLNRRKPPIGQGTPPEPPEARMLRADIVKICCLIIMSSHGESDEYRSFEMTGQQKFFRELTTLSRQESKKSSTGIPMSRFKPFVECLEFFDITREEDLVYRFVISVNCMITRVSDNLPEQTWTEDQMWQMRMRLRSEAARDGWGKHMQNLAESNKKTIGRVCESYINEQASDMENLVGKYESLKSEYDSLDGCFELLASSASTSAVEPMLLAIFQLMVLVPEEITARRAYMKLIECAISEVVFNGVDPDPESPFVFEMPVSEILEQLQDDETSKKLRQATAAKHAAVAMQSNYWKAIQEYQKETELLRKHVADPNSIPLPPPTKCNLSAPDLTDLSTPSTSSGLPPVTGGPPPPPPPGGLPPITGGPPPPPPPGGLPPVVGGPPPPPPPPGMGSGIPPPPPPPPPSGMLGKGPGPPGPPPPPFPLGGIAPVMLNPLPEYLPPKKTRKVDVPMRKFPWGSSTINPKDIPRESFWVSTNEDALASDKLFDRLKQRFSSKPPSNALKADTSNGLVTKKAKIPQVIQDDKLLQKLGILQGSVKMSYDELKIALLEIDEKVLSQGLLEQLRLALPPAEDLRKLSEVDKKLFEEMPEGEQFAASLATINALPLRLDLIHFKMRFDEILNELKPSMSSVMEACEEIRKSDGLRTFLQLALAIGNFMGATTKNFNSTYAFELRTLTRLVDTKDVENKHTLLHHLIEEMKKIDPKRAKFAMKDFHHCAESSRVNAEELQKSINQFKANRNKLENCLKTYKAQSGRDRFEDRMKPFLLRVNKEVSTVESMNEKMQRDWASLAKYFAFDTKKYPLEEFFVDIRTFSEQYTAAWRELEAEAEAERAEARRKEKASQATMQRSRNPLAERQIISSQAAARVNARPVAAIADDKMGVLDELERATGGERFLERFLQGARTPRSGPPRTKAGRAALQRQRSRGHDSFMSAIAAMSEEPRMPQSSRLTEPMRESSPLDRVKAVGTPCAAVLNGAGELKMKVRRRGAPAVPVEMTNKESSSRQQTSPTHKENWQPTAGESSASPAVVKKSASRVESTKNDELPTTEELLARLNQF
ncbi:unnamed protein product [Caenorhabditis auriculariae]|uniref:Uncharacterized protein n=1 Tax=Caenorhabditis auriculariae TaxID=2777116 RepID=A0A8S1GXS0_9PELO|nr:unnamed protein product [Caenorhabditis auriculariae]